MWPLVSWALVTGFKSQDTFHRDPQVFGDFSDTKQWCLWGLSQRFLFIPDRVKE